VSRRKAQENVVTHYEVLQISVDALPEVVEASWKALLKKYHPDVNRSQSAKAKAVALNQAHEVLSDPVKRNEYDRSLAQGAANGNGHARRTTRNRRPSPGGAYEPAYGAAYAGERTPAPRDPAHLMQEFIQDVAKTGNLAVDSFLDAASELMLSKLGEASPVLAALMREQLERNRR
jgi:curved DNA-binding protein CbpA